ncbi:MAG: hypothetical protein L6R38_000916 [Xanthoria sp. 2 TBL-2021]|nr:MAG: hypothetical protein L6R38_000916 [Xanthoria sp. 2 TBL-2021]
MGSSSFRCATSKIIGKVEGTKRPTGLYDLPTEVLTEIFELVKCERRILMKMFEISKLARFGDDLVPFKDPNMIKPNEETPSYKSFRGVSRLWYDIATPFLFESVVLLPNIDSWKCLRSICEKQHLAQNVRTVRVVTSPQLERFENRRRWRKARTRYDLRYPTLHSDDSIPNGGPLAKVSHDNDSAWKRYCTWYKNEKVIANHHANGTAPNIPLNLLSDLRQVLTTSDYELKNVRRRYKPTDRDGYWESFRDGTVREVMTKVPDMSEIHNYIDKMNFDVFLRALHDSGATIPSLTLRTGLMLFDSPCQYSIRSLRCLKIDLDTREDILWYEEGDRSRIQQPPQLSTWMHDLSELEELSITSHSSDIESHDLYFYFTTVCTPKLRKLYLYYPSSTYDEVKAFSEAYKALRISLPFAIIIDWDPPMRKGQ